MEKHDIIRQAQRFAYSLRRRARWEMVEPIETPADQPAVGARVYAALLLVDIDSFNAQPEAPAFLVAGHGQAGASGWALNEEMCHASPVAV